MQAMMGFYFALDRMPFSSRDKRPMPQIPEKLSVPDLDRVPTH
jgi:hypothetical protein